MTGLPSLDLLIFAACAWLALGLAGLLAPGNTRFIARFLFPLGAAIGIGVGLLALGSLGGEVEVAVLSIGLPGLPFHLRLDNLSAIFALLLGFVAAGISLFAAGYFRRGQGTLPGLLCLQYHLFLASMGMVLLADDAYAFMVAWESMALCSYFLVTTQHRHPRDPQRRLSLPADRACRRDRDPAELRRHAGWQLASSPSTRCAQRHSRRAGRRWPSLWRCSASAPRRAWCRCTCGCPRRIRPRPRRCRRCSPA
jgi:hypothetical protein